MAKGTLRVNGVLIAEDIHKIVQESGDSGGGGTGVGDEILLETGFHILTEASANAVIQANTGDNIVIREDDGTAVLTVDTSGRATFTGDTHVGTDDVGHDVKFFGATAGKYMEWDESADQLDVTGSLDVTGNSTMVGTLTVGVNDTGHDVKFFGATSGKYMEWDESADQLDVTGSFDVTGNSTMVGTLTVGVDDTGHDVKFFGATAGAYMLWDESQDDLIIGGAGRVGIGTTAPAASLDVVGEVVLRRNAIRNPRLQAWVLGG